MVNQVLLYGKVREGWTCLQGTETQNSRNRSQFLLGEMDCKRKTGVFTQTGMVIWLYY